MKQDKRVKIAFVIPRYGEDLSGGSEYECQQQVARLKDIYDIDVYTSCARTYFPWDNYYKPGAEISEGIRIFRFPVESNKGELYPERLRQFISGNRKPLWTEPYVPSLIRQLLESNGEYKVVFFMPYDYYTTVAGIIAGVRNAVMIPCAHFHEALFSEVYHQVFSKITGVIFQSPEERELVQSFFSVSKKVSMTTCIGMDQKVSDEVYILPDKYIVYVGRVGSGKNIKELLRYFAEYKRKRGGSLRLLIAGAVDNGMKLMHHDDVTFLGYAEEEKKDALIRGASILVMPSKYESLSIVVLEAMQLGTPVLVNGECDVLKGQCRRSNAGLYYDNYLEFEGCLDFLLDDDNGKTLHDMGSNGKQYVKENYQWSHVIENFRTFIEQVCDDVQTNITEKKDICDTRNDDVYQYDDVLNRVRQNIESRHSNVQDKYLLSSYYVRMMTYIKEHDQIVIVGSGKYGRKWFEALRLERKDNDVVCFCDNDVYMQGLDVGGKVILSIENAIREYPKALFLVTPSSYENEILRQLIELGTDIQQVLIAKLEYTGISED